MVEMEVKEAKVNSSARELAEFHLYSPIWADIQRELEVWITALKDLLLSAETNDLSEIYMIRGRVQALEAVMQLPSNLAEAKQADMERDRRNG